MDSKTFYNHASFAKAMSRRRSSAASSTLLVPTSSSRSFPLTQKLLASQHQTGQSGHKGPSAMQTRESNSSVSHGCSDVDGEGIENAGTVPRAQRPSDEQNTAAQSRGTCPGDGVAEQTIQMCVECEDQHAELECLTCDEPFCRPCWGSLHRYVHWANHLSLYKRPRTQVSWGGSLQKPIRPSQLPSPLQLISGEVGVGGFESMSHVDHALMKHPAY